MKKIVLSIVGSMLISLCAVQAQQYDTAGRASNRGNEQQNKQQYEKSQKQRDQKRQKRQAWRQDDKSQDGSQANEGMVIIDKDEIPASLKETLQQEKYAGWENGTIYHNTNTGEYVIAPRAYRFSEEGEEIDPGDMAYGSRDTDASRYDQSQNKQDEKKPNQKSEQDARAQQDGRRSETNTSARMNETDRQRNQSDRESSQTQDQPSQEQDQSTQAQDRSSQAQDQSAKAQDQSSRAQDESAQAQDQASGTQERSYDQSKYNEQLREDRASGDDQQNDEQSTRARENDASSQQDQSNAYRREDTQSGGENEQQPSSSYRGDDDQQSDRTSANQPQQTSEDAYRSHPLTEGMTEIEADQISPSLRRTLNEGDYSGWEEEGVFYQDPATNEIVLIMKNTDDASQAHFYRFDKNGKLKDSQTGSRQE